MKKTHYRKQLMQGQRKKMGVHIVPATRAPVSSSTPTGASTPVTAKKTVWSRLRSGLFRFFLTPIASDIVPWPYFVLAMLIYMLNLNSNFNFSIYIGHY